MAPWHRQCERDFIKAIAGLKPLHRLPRPPSKVCNGRSGHFEVQGTGAVLTPLRTSVATTGPRLRQALLVSMSPRSGNQTPRPRLTTLRKHQDRGRQRRDHHRAALSHSAKSLPDRRASRLRQRWRDDRAPASRV